MADGEDGPQRERELVAERDVCKNGEQGDQQRLSRALQNLTADAWACAQLADLLKLCVSELLGECRVSLFPLAKAHRDLKSLRFATACSLVLDLTVLVKRVAQILGSFLGGELQCYLVAALEVHTHGIRSPRLMPVGDP